MTNQNNYHHVIRRGEEWELSIISTPTSNGGHIGLFEVGLVHNHDQYDLGRHVEIIETWRTFEEVGNDESWFRTTPIPQIEERFNSLKQHNEE